MVIVGVLSFSAFQIFRSAQDQLMDHELPQSDREAIRKIILSNPEVQGMHDLRTRRSGIAIFIQCHIELDGAMSLYQAHVISDGIEHEITQAFVGAEVIIHLDPFADQPDRFDQAAL